MTLTDKKVLMGIVAEAVTKTVNGKIDKIQAAMDDHIEQHKINDASITAFHLRAEPVLQAFENATNARTFAWQIVLGLAKLFVAIGAIFAGILAVKEWIKR